VTTGRVKVPKTRHSRRDIPLSPTMARRLWRLQRNPEQLLFTTPTGERLRRENTYRRILAPAGKAAGIEWMAFHSLRHTCASLLFEDGRNIKQIQHWLGHHSAAYTLSSYVHLMDDGAGDADFLDAVIADALTRAARAGSGSGGDEGEIEPRNQPEIPSASGAASPA
jgi:integrase